MPARTMDSRSPRSYASGILIHDSSKFAGSLEEVELDADLVEDEASAGLERIAAYQARTPYDEAHPKALAVYCSDGRPDPIRNLRPWTSKPEPTMKPKGGVPCESSTSPPDRAATTDPSPPRPSHRR